MRHNDKERTYYFINVPTPNIVKKAYSLERERMHDRKII